MPDPIRLSLSLANPIPNPDGGYEILAITSGLGNGWMFGPKVLQNSLSLWDGVHCFLDHSLSQRSIKDIAGILTDPIFDEESQGIRAILKPLGPGATLLSNLAPTLITTDSPDYKIGFSADLSFLGSNHTVTEIVKVHSVDLVVNPARGGKFLKAASASSLQRHEWATSPHGDAGFIGTPRANAENIGFQARAATSRAANAENIGFRRAFNKLNSEIKGEYMPETQDPDTTPNPETETPQPAEPAAAPAGTAQDPAQISTQLQKELDQVSALRRQLSSVTLDQLLETSHLPKASIDHIKRQFTDRDFTLEQAQSAIAEQRQLLSDLTASDSIHSPARIESAFNESDRLQAAVHDLFGVPREPEQANLKAPRLSGIRELYLTLTGDTDLHGGYYPERVQLATTADFSGLVKNALNKLVVNTWEELGRAGYDWWKDITVQEHFNTLHDITGTLIGTVGDLPVVNEGAAYTELKVGDSPETASFTKYGGYLPLTLELIDRDETRKLRAYARELASAGLRKISNLVAAIFSGNGGIGPDMSDGGALFNATAVATLGGHANLSTTALSLASWDAVSASVYKQPMLIKNALNMYGTGPQMAVNPKFVLVPRALQKTAMEICGGSFVRESGYVYDNVLKGSAVPVVVPDWTDANDWAAACDPRIAPAIFIGDRFGLVPEIYIAGSELSPAVFTNDEHRIKVRHFLAVWVNDFRPLHKANVV